VYVARSQYFSSRKTGGAGVNDIVGKKKGKKKKKGQYDKSAILKKRSCLNLFIIIIIIIIIFQPSRGQIFRSSDYLIFFLIFLWSRNL